MDKKDLFENMPVGKALRAMAFPTIISQVINLVYNMVDAFFIGRTGNSYMMAATSLTLTLMMMCVAFSNLFGVGGGSLIARLMGAGRKEQVRPVSAFSCWGALIAALIYSSLIGIFLNPFLRFLGASDATIGYCRQYTILVLVIGSCPVILSMVLAHLLRNIGYARQASIGLSGGGILNMVLDPLFMFVILPRGKEVLGAALATLISYFIACIYLLITYRKSFLSFRPSDARSIGRENLKSLFKVGIPSAILVGLFDIASMAANMLAAAHDDLTLAALGIVMKVERVPNAINIGICQGMLPIIAYNFSSGNSGRMLAIYRLARKWGLMIAAGWIVLFQISAPAVVRLFLNVSGEDALLTVSLAAVFLRLRCIASPVQFMNYHSSFCMQAMGEGRRTLIHAVVRELVLYIPMMIVMDRIFGERGLALALPLAEACGAVFAVWLLGRCMREKLFRAPAAAPDETGAGKRGGS